VLIVGQLALSLVLLVAAGLFIRALNQGQRIDPGFERAGVITASLEPESWGYDRVKAHTFYRTLLERVQALPGTVAASYAGRLPLMMGSSPDDIKTDDGTNMGVHTAVVDADYFSVLQLPLMRGRAFRTADNEEGERVAIVNETLARRLSPDGSAIGRTFRFRDARTTIVGIARDAKYATLDETTPPFVYLPIAQQWQPGQVLLVRTAGDPEQFTSPIQQAVLSIDPSLPRPRMSTLQRATGIVLLPQHTAAIVTGALGGFGLLLAAVGLYGIMAFSASRRTREIGIRMALGARRSTVLTMMIRDGLRLAAVGTIVGLVLAAAATRLIAGWLFDISPLDAPAFIGMSSVLIVVSLVATYLPARRAAASDPLTALRAE
jgi:predicted permease